MENTNEAVQIIPAIVKGAAVAAKGAAKVAAAGGKAAAKGGKVAAKAGAKATKGAAKATKPASKNLKFKRPNIRSYKDPKTGKVNMDKYRSDQTKYKQIKKDQASRPDMSNTKPDGPSDARTKRGDRKLKAIDKLTQKKTANLKKGMQDTGDVAKKTVKKTGEYAKKSTSAVSGAFGTSSFTKEGITFKDYLNKL